jgi:hypothetical protein
VSNIILDKDIIPESWGKGILIPISKNKGSKSDPNSYRGVTLNSCISKVFSAVLNTDYMWLPNDGSDALKIPSGKGKRFACRYAK